MASETLCLFAFVVNPSPCFHAHSTGGAYHLAKPNCPGKNGWNFMRKWSKRTPIASVVEYVPNFFPLGFWVFVSGGARE